MKKCLGVLLRSTGFLLLSVLFFTALLSCGSGGYGGLAETEGDAAYKMDARRSGAALSDFAAEAVPAQAPAEAAVEAPAPASQEPPDADSGPGSGGGERKLVSTGSMDLIVDDLEEAEVSIRSAVEELGGYISSVTRWSDSFSMTVKVPASDFDRFVESTGELGDLLSKQIEVDDVTEYYYDLEHRIRNKEILVERFRSYLSRAEDIEEILKVERELSETVTELEQLEGSFRNLAHLVSFSTLHLSVRLPSYASDHGPLPSIRKGLKEFGYTVVRVFYAIFFIVLGVIVFGVPLLLVTGLLYWLGFGKVGLLRSFFRKLRPQSGKERAGKAPEGGKEQEG
jgi:hypothetical protein